MPPQVPFTNVKYPVNNVKTDKRYSPLSNPYPFTTSFAKSVSILKPQPKPTITHSSMQPKHTSSVPRSTNETQQNEQSQKNEDTPTEDDEIAVIPGPSYKVQEGILKRVFLDKMEEKEFLVQLVMGQDLTHSRRVLIISDTRDSTANYTIQDNSLVTMVKKNIFPVIRVMEWNIAAQTINILKFIIVDKVKTTLGNPKPIQKSFYNYIKNLIKKEKSASALFAKIRCKSCPGCQKKTCRMGGTGRTPCTRCEANDKENCVRRKCITWLHQKNPEPPAPEVTDINLLQMHHPLRARCNKCFNCKSGPCRKKPMNKMCEKCKANENKRCLMRICFEWTRYSITSSDIKEIEEQQARILDMLKNPPAKVLLLHKPSENDQDNDIAAPQNIEPVVAVQKDNPGEELDKIETIISEPAAIVKKEKLGEELDLTDTKIKETDLDITDTKIVVEFSSSEENICKKSKDTADLLENSYGIKTEIKTEAADDDDDIEPTLFIVC